MTEKLDVIITERPGLYSIDNFEELKEALQEYTRQYLEAQFDCSDDESRKVAKGICADLRKMKDTIESRRKEIKKSCLEPYTILETKCKELTSLIDKATIGIDTQLKEYEAQRRAQKKERIKEIFDDVAGEDLKEYVSMDEFFDDKWLNAKVSASSIRESIEFHIAALRDQLEAIRQMPDDVQQAVIPVWKTTKDMTAIAKKVTEFNEQKERILEAERKRREEAEREKAEQVIRNEIMQEQKIEELQQKAVDLDDGYMEIPDFGDVPANDLKTVWFRITGNPEELDSIRVYLTSLGVPFEEKEV